MVYFGQILIMSAISSHFRGKVVGDRRHQICLESDIPTDYVLPSLPEYPLPRPIFLIFKTLEDNVYTSFLLSGIITKRIWSAGT